MYAARVPKGRVQSVGIFSRDRYSLTRHLTLAIFVATTRVATRVAKSKNKITRESFVSRQSATVFENHANGNFISSR